MAQVAAQAEEEARRRLLASAADPPAARRLAAILRTLAEAAGAGAREGRARLMLELLSVEPPADRHAPRAPIAPAAGARRTRGCRSRRRSPPAPKPSAAAEPSRALRRHSRRPNRSRRPRPAAGRGRLRARWAEVVDRANPVIKPLLKECRPIALDGARLTLAFPEGRDFMRSRISQRAGAIEALLDGDVRRVVRHRVRGDQPRARAAHRRAGDRRDTDDPEAQALLEGVLKITGGELVDAPEVR